MKSENELEVQKLKWKKYLWGFFSLLCHLI